MKHEQNKIFNNKTPLTTKNFVFFVLSLIYYFFIVEIIIVYLIAPPIVNANRDKMVDPNMAASNIMYEVIMHDRGMAIIKSSDYDKLIDNYKDPFKGDSYTIIIETLIIKDDVFEISDKNENSYYLISNIKNKCDICFLENNNFDIDQFNYFINNAKEADFKFFYNSLIYTNENFKDNSIYIPVSSASDYFSSLINFINYILLFIPFIIFYYQFLKVDFDDFNKMENKASNITTSIFHVLLISYGLGLIRLLLLRVFNQPMVSTSNQSAIESILKSSSAPLMILSAVILGPFVEEFIFRKTVFTLSKNKIVALIISSLLFGLVHVSNEPTILMTFINLIPYLGAGLFFGYLYLKNNENTLTLFIIHAIYNLISIMLALIV